MKDARWFAALFVVAALDALALMASRYEDGQGFRAIISAGMVIAYVVAAVRMWRSQQSVTLSTGHRVVVSDAPMIDEESK